MYMARTNDVSRQISGSACTVKEAKWCRLQTSSSPAASAASRESLLAEGWPISRIDARLRGTAFLAAAIVRMRYYIIKVAGNQNLGTPNPWPCFAAAHTQGSFELPGPGQTRLMLSAFGNEPTSLGPEGLPAMGCTPCVQRLAVHSLTSRLCSAPSVMASFFSYALT